MMDPVAVFSLDRLCASAAEALASNYSLLHIEAANLSEQSSKERLRFYHKHLPDLPALAFIMDAGALHLALIDEKGVLAISAGFHGSATDYRREKGGGRSEMIARAVGLKGGKTPSVIDATAGLGVDAFVLASLGCQVTLVERVPAVRALLDDGLRRSRDYAAGQDSSLAGIMDRMQLVYTDSIAYLDALDAESAPDVVYLDPMFPERKKSAAVKKEMQLFHQLIGPDDDADQLLESALGCASERVVVKRPRIAPSLAGPEPSHVMEGKRNRYDVYLTASRQA